LASINQGVVVSRHIGNLDENLGGHDVAPMELEEGSLPPDKEKVQGNKSFHQ